jgi:transposase
MRRTFDLEAAFVRYRNGERPVEIAAALGANSNTVRQALYQARKRGVDLGPPRHRGRPPGRNAECRAGKLNRSTYYRKMRYVLGMSRVEAVAACRQLDGEGA